MVYHGPKGFLVFFLGKFCKANQILLFFYWHEALMKINFFLFGVKSVNYDIILTVLYFVKSRLL